MDFEKFSNSQSAIKSYLNIDRDNEYPHKTDVVVIQDTKIIFEGVLSAWARIGTNYSSVNITWENSYLEDKYYSEYRNDYQEIKYDGKFLIVIAKDKQGYNIKICIRWNCYSSSYILVTKILDL